MMTPDVNVVVIDFKTAKGNEMVTCNEDGSYTNQYPAFLC